MENIEIPFIISGRGKDTWIVDEAIFGIFQDKEQPNRSYCGREKTIEAGVVIKKKSYSIFETAGSWQDINVYLDIAKSIGIDVAIGIAGAYLYDILKKFNVKIRVGNKDVTELDKEAIIKVLKEEIEKLRKDLKKE